jgi:16S rRNA (cytosine967-C5)-methyltransferase
VGTVRHAAVRVLTAVERGLTTLPDAVEHERRDLEDRRDRALLLELAAGTMRWQNALDFVLADASRRRLDELAPPVRAILRLSAFQLRHLDRVPDHAVIHEAVELARRTGHPRAAGFVNAVLRTVVRRASRVRLPPRPQSGDSRAARVTYLSITLSHPAWLAERWLDRYGFERAEAWCRFNNEPPELTLRHRTSNERLDLGAEAERAGVVLRPARYVTGAFVAEAGALGRLPPEVQRQITIQDEGSQLVALATPLAAGGRVLDLCAAPGNKTAILAQRTGPHGQVVACDLRARRVAILRQTLAAAEVDAAVVRLDAGHALPFPAVFDTVLLDAPCSGLGTLRRDPDLKWSRAPEDLPALAARQARMLDQAASAVRPGGALSYATCSSEPEENDEVVDAFLSTHPEFEQGGLSPDPRIRDFADLVDGRGRLRLLPFAHGLDAFFAAVLVRRQAA